MDLKDIYITPQYIIDNFNLSWQEIIYAYNNNIIDDSTVKQLAAEYLANYDINNKDALEICIAEAYDPINVYLDNLSKAENPKQNIDYIMKKWIFILIKCACDNNLPFNDLFEAIENIYVEFGYPDYLSNLIRYMPYEYSAKDELKELTLYKNLDEYLLKNKQFLKQSF